MCHLAQARLGLGYPATASQLQHPIERYKESPSRRRPDIGRTFDQVRARQHTKASAKYSPLRKSWWELCPGFERTAPRGFEPRVYIENDRGEVARSRSYNALPGWQAALESAEVHAAAGA